MTAAANKQLMQSVFSELSKGNGEPFRNAMAKDFRWTVQGSTPWSGTYSGKQAVLSELMEPLFAQFADRYTNTADRFIAEGDYVVVECHGRVTTTTGASYNNRYCYVCRLSDGKLRELTEYLDTELVSAALDPPRPASTRMIARTWRTRIDTARLDEWDRFVCERSTPMFRQQDGMRAVFHAREGDEWLTLSIWRNAAAVAALDSSHSYTTTAEDLLATGMVLREPVSEAFEVSSFDVRDM